MIVSKIFNISMVHRWGTISVNPWIMRIHWDCPSVAKHWTSFYGFPFEEPIASRCIADDTLGNLFRVKASEARVQHSPVLIETASSCDTCQQNMEPLKGDGITAVLSFLIFSKQSLSVW